MHQPPRRTPHAARRFAEPAMLGLVAACAMGGWTPHALAQWTIRYEIDQPSATASFPNEARRRKMNEAFERAKEKIERILSASTGNVVVQVIWTSPSVPGADAEAQTSQIHAVNINAARDKLINKATADNEPASEVALYESIPFGSIQFRFDTEDIRTALFIGIPNSLNQHLSFAQSTQPNDGFIRFRPESSTVKWQLFDANGNNLEDRIFLDSVIIHETFHLLGFSSLGNSESVPTSLLSWDVFRVPDTGQPLTATGFTTVIRELRPTQEAVGLTALNSAAKMYPLSRGNRPGGDGFGAGHWRWYRRLDPPNAVGAMDPGTSAAVFGNLSKQLFTRADIEALDVIGWNINPNDSSLYADAGSIEAINPVALAQIDQGNSVVFSWESSASETVSVYIFSGTEAVEENLVKDFYQLPAGTTSVTLPTTESLPPGEYVWKVIGELANRYIGSEDRRFTILPACDSLDFNNDTFSPDSGDLDDFIGVFGGGPSACSTYPVPGCNDLDFNNDGFSPDSLDIDAFISRLGGGPCLQ